MITLYHLSQLRKVLDQAGTLNVHLDETHVLKISPAEIIALCRLIEDEHEIDSAIIQAIQEKVEQSCT
jgi:hypothetical protein